MHKHTQSSCVSLHSHSLLLFPEAQACLSDCRLFFFFIIFSCSFSLLLTSVAPIFINISYDFIIALLSEDTGPSENGLYSLLHLFAVSSVPVTPPLCFCGRARQRPLTFVSSASPCYFSVKSMLLLTPATLRRRLAYVMLIVLLWQIGDFYRWLERHLDKSMPACLCSDEYMAWKQRLATLGGKLSEIALENLKGGQTLRPFGTRRGASLTIQDHFSTLHPSSLLAPWEGGQTKV